MKNKYIIILCVCIVLSIAFAVLNKRNVNIYMESMLSPPNDKIDLKLIIDDEIVFNDTLQRNLALYPTHITHSMRIGHHTISISSNQMNIHEEKEVFLLSNDYLLLYYSFDERNNKPTFYLRKGRGDFGFE